MEYVYQILKAFVDPVFIIFLLLVISFVLCLTAAKKRSGALFLLLAIVLLYGFSISAVSNYFSYTQEKEYIVSPVPAKGDEELDVIVVFGGGVYEIRALGETYPTGATALRLIHGLAMFKQYRAKYLVLSGAGLESASNAEVMAQMALDLGVPKEKIRLEAKSTNTYEHALELNRMFVDKKIRIGLVTSASHMKRSETQVRKFFQNVTALPTDFLYETPAGSPVLRFIPRSHSFMDNTQLLRERIGMIWYAAKDI